MKRLILAFFVCVLLYDNSFAQWYWVNPFPQGNDLKDIWIFDQNNSIVVGDYGTILKTSDGGKTWSIKYNVLNINTDINSLFFIDNQTGWAAGGKYILKTHDSGDHWDIQYVSEDTNIENIYFRNANDGMAVGSKGIILKTTDGGINWKTIILNTTLDTTVDLFSLNFFNEKDGIALCNHWDTETTDSSYALIYMTIDGGDHWNVLRRIDAFATGLYLLNNSTGWIFGASLYKTNDSGRTWIEQGFGAQSIISLFFLDENNGWIIRDNDIPGYPESVHRSYTSLNKTDNGGQSWKEVCRLRFGLQKLKFLNKDIAYIIQRNGNIIYTTDGGKNWDCLSKNFDVSNFISFYFPSSDVGYLLSDATKIVKTTDRGKTWELLSNTPSALFTTGHFVNETFGVLGTNGGQLYKTNNGGTSWENIDLYSQQLCTYVISISFLDTNIGFISGSPYLLKTTDGGLSWKKDERISYPSQIVFINDSTGFLTDGTGSLYTTTDLGKNWINVSSSIPILVGTITFLNEYWGYAIGKDGSVVITKDAGISWNKLDIPDEFQIKSIYLINNSLGYAVGTNGGILRTEDGGDNWIRQQSSTMNDLNSIFFLDENNGFIAGRNGVLLSTSNDCFTSIQKHPNDRLPNSYHLFQNYPNPLNPQTKIVFEVPERSFIEIEILDVKGSKIKTLVNREYFPGTYSVDFDGSQLSSGVYFYQLKSSKGIQTKKMVLVK